MVIKDIFDNYKHRHIKALTDFSDYETVKQVINLMIQCLKKRSPILIFGNGGSAADALHFSAELVGKFLHDRKPLNVIALNSNPSMLTAWSNDYEFDSVFARQVLAHGQSDGLVIGITTSGKSKNIINAFSAARSMGIKSVGMTGNNDFLKHLVDCCICVPSNETPIIQEMHVFLYHFICQEVEHHFL